MPSTASTLNPGDPVTIYVNDRPLIFTENAILYRKVHPETEAYTLLKGTDSESLENAVRRLDQESEEGILIESKDIAGGQQNLSSAFPEIEAAGGLVTEPGGKVLMIYRREKWDLPKGKIDEGETVKKAAVREVLEETGLPDVRLLAPLYTSRHIYSQHGQYILKTTHWFTMAVQESYPLIPQQEEDIAKAEWCSAERIKAHLRNSFETIKSVFMKADRMPV